VRAMKKIFVPLATLAVSAGIALAGAASAEADDDLCWNGSIWTACISVPGVDWNPGWNNWNPGHGPGDIFHDGKHAKWR